jgi:hypothetical protein
MEERALGVEAHRLAPGAHPRVNGKDAPLPHGRGHEKLPHVPGKNPDGLVVGPVLQVRLDLVFHGRGKQPLVAVQVREPHLFCTGIRPLDDASFEELERDILVGPDADLQECLAAAPEHGQDPVARRLRRRLGPVKVVPVGGRTLFRTGIDLGFEHGLLLEQGAHGRAHLGVLGDALGDDVPGPCQRILSGLHTLPCIDEGFCLPVRVDPFFLAENPLSQWLESLFPGDGCPGPPLGLVRQVDVFELGHGPG